MPETSQFFTKLIETGEFRINESGHATLFDEYLFLIPPFVVVELQERLADRVGQAEMEELMVDLGRYQVRQSADRHDKKYDLNSMTKERILDYFENIWNILGWGNTEIVQLDRKDGSMRVAVKEPTLPAEYHKYHDEPAEQPICHFFRGMITEAFNLLFDGTPEIRETSCAAVDGDRCVFEQTTG